MAKQLSTASGWIWLSTSDPGSSETQVEKGNFWLNTNSLNLWCCKDATSGLQVWNKYVNSVAAALDGGTGVANSNTITLGGNILTAAAFTTSGANALTLTTTGSTNITLPTTGTLATTAQVPSLPVAVTNGGTGLSSTTANQILYSSALNTIAGLASANNGVLITSGAGAPSISSTLPTAVQANITSLGALTSLSTAPAASQVSALSLGSAYQNQFGYDVLLTIYLNITVNTTGSILSGIGPTNTPTQQTLLSGLTVLGFFPVSIYVPKNYYALLSISSLTASIVGQQAIPI